MAAYRFYNPAPVFFDLLGLEPLDGGFLTFYDIGTTDEADTWSDPDLAAPHLNPNPIPLDSAGRASTNIFLDGEYTVVCTDAGGQEIWSRDVISGAIAGQTIPALENGEFMTNDGVNLLWATIFQMPDPTGSTNQYPVTNGAGYTLTNIPTTPDIPDPEIVVGTGSFRAGVSTDETKFLVQYGAWSAAASGTLETTGTVTFATAYTAAPTVIVLGKGGGTPSAAGNIIPRASTTVVSATGFTCAFSTRTGGSSADLSGNSNITGAIAFDWVAFGTVEVPA